MFEENFVNSNEASKQYTDLFIAVEEYLRAGTKEARKNNIKMGINQIEGIKYYAINGSEVCANISADSAKKIKENKYYRISNKGETNATVLTNRHFYEEDNFNLEMYFAFDEQYVNQKQTEFLISRDDLIITIYLVLTIGALGVLLLIYLMFVCGRDRDKNLKMMAIDRIWTEVTIALSTGNK